MLKRIKRKLIGVLKLIQYVDNEEGYMIYMIYVYVYFKISVNIIINCITFLMFQDIMRTSRDNKSMDKVSFLFT